MRPYKALLPNVALDNLVTPPPRDAATAYWMRRTEEQDLERADMANPEILNRIIWFSVKGNIPMPEISRLPAFDAMRLGLQEEDEEIAETAEDANHKVAQTVTNQFLMNDRKMLVYFVSWWLTLV